MLVDDDGLPVVDANEWLFGRRSQSPTTLSRSLSELLPLFLWAHSKGVDIRERYESGMGFLEAEITTGVVEQLRLSQGKRATGLRVSNQVLNLRIATSRAFLAWLATEVIARYPSDDAKTQRIATQHAAVDEWLADASVRQPLARSVRAKALSPQQQIKLIEHVLPDVGGLGISRAMRFRNFVVIALLLTCGLRRGELLSLRVEDITFGAISSVSVTRRPVDRDDPRRPKPRIKRGSRLLELDPCLATYLDEYIVLHREALVEKAKVDTSYLIVSDEGHPLSISRLYALFVELKAQLGSLLPENFSPHSLRHTFSEVMERGMAAAGLDEGHRARALAMLRGDASLKSQNTYLQRETREQANKALARYQRSLFDEAGRR
jgi:integrase